MALAVSATCGIEMLEVRQPRRQGDVDWPNGLGDAMARVHAEFGADLLDLRAR